MNIIDTWRKIKFAKLIQSAIDNPALFKSRKWWTDTIVALVNIKEVRLMLAGYKTYIVAAISAFVIVAHSLGYIDDATRDTLLGLLASGGLATVAAKMNRFGANVDKKFIILLPLLLMTYTSAYAQGARVVATVQPAPKQKAEIEFGIGMGVALTNSATAVEAVVDSFGVTHVTKTLDEGPQLFLDVHYDIPIGNKMGFGPVLGVFPKVDFGSVSNTETEQPVAGGLGMMLRMPTNTKQHFNLVFLWAISTPSNVLNEQWKDGFQAPRGINGQPLPPEYNHSSVHRFMLVGTISNLFGH